MSFMKKIIFGVVLLFFAISLYKLISVTKYSVKEDTTLYSRKWIEHGITIVKAEKPTPPESSRLYAYISSVYADILTATNNTLEASEGTRRIINKIYPEWKDKTDEVFTLITGKANSDLSTDALAVLETFIEREKTDGFYDLTWDENVPIGEGKWQKLNKVPYSPRAGEWKRWIIDQQSSFQVPPPPIVNSSEDLEELEIVKDAIAKRDEAWNKKIIFWQGIPGTEAPAGIWLNILFNETHDMKLTDKQFATYQKILSQSLADSFMECWKVKYTYWTARPSMRLPGIVTSMPDPPFPSYLSGHSTISRTSAEVLSAFFPEKQSLFLSMAEEARDSRLYAGIHFQYDNTQGFLLGEEIGKEIVSVMRL
jgi:hypothetical protein